MTLELNVEEGFQEIMRRLEQIKERPLLVAVYGWPRSGKSTLIERIRKYFFDKGEKYVYDGAGKPDEHVFRCVRDYNPEFYDMVRQGSAQNLVQVHDSREKSREAIDAEYPQDYSPRETSVFLFHCAWDRISGNRDHEDPHVLVERIANKKMHLNVYVYNPMKVNRQNIKGDYDLIICNPHS